MYFLQFLSTTFPCYSVEEFTLKSIIYTALFALFQAQFGSTTGAGGSKDTPDDEEDTVEDEEEESIMFERECEILEKMKDSEEIKRLGQVEIRIIYDDDVYGARIIANKQVRTELTQHLN